MSKKKVVVEVVRRRYTVEYKQEALSLADRVGVAKAASQLGLAEAQLYQWRVKSRAQSSQSEREQQLALENARLKHQLAEKTE